MRDVLRLVDVDLLQNCNGRSTIAQADDLLKRVVRHGGLLIRHDELPSRVAALRGGVRGLPPQESEGDIRQSAVLQEATRAVGDQLVQPQDIELQEKHEGVLRNAATVLGHALGIHTLPDWKILHAVLDGPVDRRSQQPVGGWVRGREHVVAYASWHDGRTEMDATGLYRTAVSSAPISIPGMRLAPTTVEVELDDEAGFDEDKARRDAINSFENIWTNWMELAATIDWAIQDCSA